MKIDTTFLHSRVARRIFLQFVLCALFPIGILAFFSSREVTQQLTRESEARLLQATRAQGMSIYERLTLLEAEMKVIESEASRDPVSPGSAEDSVFPPELKNRFAGVAEVESSGGARMLFGTLSSVPELSAAETTWVESGHTALSVLPGLNHSFLYMTRMLDPRRPERGRLVAELNADYVWGIAALPTRTDLCVFDLSYQPVFCSAGVLPLSPVEADRSAEFLSELFRQREGDPYVTRHWEIFLKPQFGAPKWTVVLGEPRSQALALLAPFEKTFPYVTLLSIWLVTLLSLIHVRRSLVPLELLKEATERMSGFNFGPPVSVNSKDEFQDLANSFNTMADRLNRQFQTLESINQIDRAILSSLDAEKIVRTVLTQLGPIVPLDCVSMTVTDPRDAQPWKTYLACRGCAPQSPAFPTCLTGGELAELRRNPEVLLLRNARGPRSYLACMIERGMQSFLVFPLVLQGKVLGIICMGHASPLVLSDEHIFQARRVADQVSVALSNVSLIQQLADLHIGTLTALARTIDAKSAWTSGHSERVTAFAVRIGKAMGLPQKELELLHRGGLLHDIGKIGIPPGILDKPSKLSPEEFRQMREHVRIGARILEPIPGFQEVIPIVLQHHEWFDGSGYPDGVAGEAINLNARIFALADCYDALTSDRPYRPGIGRKRALEMIREETGTHFDPAVVEAFYRVISEETPRQDPRETGEHSNEHVGVAAEGNALP